MLQTRMFVVNFHLFSVFKTKRYLKHLITQFSVFFLHNVSLNAVLHSLRGLYNPVFDTFIREPNRLV